MKTPSHCARSPPPLRRRLMMASHSSYKHMHHPPYEQSAERPGRYAASSATQTRPTLLERLGPPPLHLNEIFLSGRQRDPVPPAEISPHLHPLQFREWEVDQNSSIRRTHGDHPSSAYDLSPDLRRGMGSSELLTSPTQLSVPGLWGAAAGASHTDIHVLEFFVEADVWYVRWRSHCSKFSHVVIGLCREGDGAVSLTLRAVSTDEVTRLQGAMATMKPALTRAGVADELCKLHSCWPRRNTLVIELNGVCCMPASNLLVS